MLGGIEEDDLIAALRRGFGLGDEAGGIVAAALGRTGATRSSAGIILGHPDFDRLGAALEIGADRRGDDAEDIFLRRAHAEEGLAGEHEGAQIEAAFPLRDPLGVDAHQLLDGVEEIGFRQFRHRHAAGGFVEAAGVFLRAEENGAAIGAAIGLHALEDFLGVMQHAAGRIDRERSACQNLGRMPALVRVPADHGHVVGKQGSEAEVFERLEAVGFRHGVGIGLDVEGQALGLHGDHLSTRMARKLPPRAAICNRICIGFETRIREAVRQSRPACKGSVSR